MKMFQSEFRVPSSEFQYLLSIIYYLLSIIKLNNPKN
jgi:hypothetical protein